MSIRSEINRTVRVDNAGCRNMEDVTIYVTDKEEALSIDTTDLLIGSTLFIVQSATIYMLDADGGVWRSIRDGLALN